MAEEEKVGRLQLPHPPLIHFGYACGEAKPAGKAMCSVAAASVTLLEQPMGAVHWMDGGEGMQ